VRKRARALKGGDVRDIPVLRALAERSSLEEIRKTVEEMAGRKDPMCRKLCIHVSHQYEGFALKEIGRF